MKRKAVAWSVYLLGLSVMVSAALLTGTVVRHVLGPWPAFFSYPISILFWGWIVGRTKWYLSLVRRANAMPPKPH